MCYKVAMSIRNPLRRALLPLTALLLVAPTGGCSDDDEAAAVGLTILYTSDEHSRLFASSPELDDYPLATSPGSGALRGGVARRAAVLAAERARAQSLGNDVLTLSAGDNTMGALPHVAFESQGLDYRIMHSLGYDATTLGNHELDFGPGALARAIEAARAVGEIPPIIASNIHFDAEQAGDDELEALYSSEVGDGAAIHPYRVIATAGGARVGIIGFVGGDASEVAPNKTPVRFSAETNDQEGSTTVVLPKLYAELQSVVDQLRNVEQVDLVVGLGHSGLGHGEDITEAEDYLICQKVGGLDIIISGHSHRIDAAPGAVANAGGGQCLVLNGGAYGHQLGRFDLTVVPGGDEAPSWDAATQTLLSVDDTTVPAAEWTDRID